MTASTEHVTRVDRAFALNGWVVFCTCGCLTGFADTAAGADKIAADHRVGMKGGAMERNWTTVGAEVVERIGGRDDVVAAIEKMDWQEVPVGDKLTVGFIPGEAINATIRELGIPKVSAIAVDSFECPVSSPDEDGFYPGFYGIEGHYKNGRARVYVVDVGTTLLPVVSDFYPEGVSA